MNITPELAAKVLDADLRNIVKKVSDGGILSPSERQMLQNAAFPESQAKAKRALALALKYSSGARLTAGELAEVREMHPGFAPEAVADDTAAPGSAPLTLTPEPSPARGDGEVTRTQLDAWSKTYATEHRQIRRWIARGRERGDPCPLDDPLKMPAWIDKHLDKIRGTLREKVSAAAEAARAQAPADLATSSPASASAAGVAADSAASGVAGPTVQSLDLATVGGMEGESVGFFRTLFAGVKRQLEEAYKLGADDRIRTLHSRLEKLGESLRKHEVAAEARAKRLGDYLEKSEVFNEVMAALNTLALLRECRNDRVRGELSDLPKELLDRIAAALDRVGSSEEDVLRSLACLKSPADVYLALAA